jgi:anaerobic carbon-monoxide dehydrogenase iron sulfur subunit
MLSTVFVNPERCIGCMQCEFACAVAHSQSGNSYTAVAELPLPQPRIHVERGPTLGTSYPNRCRHCDPAPCLQVCPTAAIFRDPDFGQVLIDEQACIGCAMCAIVCPFDALTFHATPTSAGRSVAVKCDACIARLRRDELPACVEVCKVGALVFGEINRLTDAGRLEHALTVLTATASQSVQHDGSETVDSWRELARAAHEVGQAGGM